MKHYYGLNFLLILIFLSFQSINGQDIGVVAKLVPNSGCELSSAETVTVQVFNFGSSISVPFDVAYQINGQPPVIETISLGTFNASSSYSHTFSINANLVAQGVFNMKFYTSLSSDVNHLNDTIFATIVSDATTVPGNLPSDFSVCELSNSGSIDLTGNNGSVTDWEQSVDGGVSWTSLSNTLTNQTYSNLTVDTEFRAIVKNGLCPQDISDTVLVSIDAESIGGNLSGPSSICTPPNSVAITLNNHQGNISDWEYSEDNGATWQSLGQSSNPLNLSNVTQTTMYRAIVQNGSCTAVFSDTLEIIVISNLDGGVLSPGITSVCEGANSGTIDLNGYVGNIDYWEYSNDQVSWTTIPNSTSAYSFSNLNNTTYFRVIVSGCTTDTSSVSEVNVSTLSSVGSLGSDITICQNESVMNLSPSTYNADNFNWESSVDGGNTWQSESSSIPASFLNVSQSKLVRLIVQNGACPSITSDTINILVDSLQFVSGFVAKDSVCEGNNSDTIVPTIITGNVNTWVNSIDGGLSWIDLGVSLDSLITNNVTATTIYGVVLSSGVCPVDTFYHEVMVSQPSSFGSIVGDSTVCINTSNHSVYLSNQVADSYVWYSSLDSNTNYSIQNSSIDSLFLGNVDEPIYVYCEVNNGVCPSVISDTIMIDVFSANYGITGDTVVALYSSVELTAFGGVSYSWDANSALDNLSSSNVNAQINNPEIFYVNITDINGCDYRDSISIDVINEAFEISTLITANNDGYNDFWIIKKPVDVASVKVTVLNVFGQIVYSSNDYQNDWDAHYENKILPNGTYYFIVEEESIGKIKGNLNIVGNEK